MNDNIPTTDLECWEKYPSFKWVYDLSRLLDSQHIKWAPYKTPEFNEGHININLINEKKKDVISNNEIGYIFTQPNFVEKVTSEVFILKGEIKLIRHIDRVKDVPIYNLIGEVELRINAFITLYFQKFTGIICVETHQNRIFGISLKPYFKNDTNEEVEKITKKIYKKQVSEIPVAI